MIDTTHAFAGSSDVAAENGLNESGLRKKLQGIEKSSGSGHDLSSTSVDSVGVEFAVDDVESHTSHVFVTKDTLLGGPLEGGNYRFLDFVHVLDTLGDIDDHVGSSIVGSEAPDLGGVFLFPIEFLTKSFSSGLDILGWGDITIFDEVGKIFMEGLTGSVDSVVLVLRLGHAGLAGLGSHGFLVGDDWVSLDDFALSVVLFKIVKTDLDVEFTATGNDVFS